MLGFGNIGSRISRLIAAFGAKVIAVDGRAQAGEIATEVFPNDHIKDAVAKADGLMNIDLILMRVGYLLMISGEWKGNIMYLTIYSENLIKKIIKMICIL